MNKDRNSGTGSGRSSKETKEAARNYDSMVEKASQERRTKEPGSKNQGSTKRHNNGRGGGK